MSDPIRPYVETFEETTNALAAVEAARADHETRILAVEGLVAGGPVDTPGTASAGDYAKFTDANTIEGIAPANVPADLGLEIGVDVQAYSANLDEYAAVNPTAAGLALLDDANAATQLTTLGVSAFAQTILDDANAAAVRATIGAGTGNGDALTTNPLSQFAATTSAQLRGVISDETGNGAAVFQNGDLGIPTAAVLTNATGLPTAGLVNDAVTFPKMQNIATDRLIGRDTASSGDPEELTVGGGIEFSGSGGIQLATKIRTRSHIFYSAAPAVELLPMFNVPANATITYVAGKTDAGSVTVNLYKRNESTPDSGTTDVFASSMTFDTTWASKTITNAAITARQWLCPNVATIASGSPTKLWILVEYTID